MSAIGYGAVGVLAGLTVAVFAALYCAWRLRSLMARVLVQSEEIKVLEGFIAEINERLWQGGKLTAEEERAGRRGVYTFDLPKEEQTARDEPLLEASNSHRRRVLALGKRLEKASKSGLP